MSKHQWHTLTRSDVPPFPLTSPPPPKSSALSPVTFGRHAHTAFIENGNVYTTGMIPIPYATRAKYRRIITNAEEEDRCEISSSDDEEAGQAQIEKNDKEEQKEEEEEKEEDHHEIPLHYTILTSAAIKIDLDKSVKPREVYCGSGTTTVLCQNGDVYCSIGAKLKMLELVQQGVERVEVSRWGVHLWLDCKHKRKREETK